MSSNLKVNTILPSTGTAIGIGTANGTINFLGNSNINTTGVITATTFSGSGASLTNLPSAQLTGALPAIDGSNLTGISAGTSLSGSTNNTVCTVTGANAIQGESGLTYYGTVLNISNDIPQLYLTDTNSNNSYGRVRGNGGNLVLSADHNNASALSTIVFESDGSEKARIDNYGTLRIGNVVTTEATSSNTKRIALGAKGSIFGWTSGNINGAITIADNYYWDGANNKTIENDYSAYLTLRSGNLRFGTTSQAHSAGGNISTGIHERFRVETNGNATINNGDLVIGTSGHGISFAATADGTGSSQAEILDDYEEGSWTPAVSSGNASFSTMTGRYTKVGNKVTLWVKISGGGSYSGSGALQINGLPFSNNTAVHPIGNSEYYKIDFARDYSDHVTPYIAGQNLQWLRNGSGGGSGNYLTVNLFYSGASINTCITYNTNS